MDLERPRLTPETWVYFNVRKGSKFLRNDQNSEVSRSYPGVESVFDQFF
jgi:hypothetical protein